MDESSIVDQDAVIDQNKAVGEMGIFRFTQARTFKARF